jgi:hypothetical protein
MTHLQNKLAELMIHWNKFGFNDVPVNASNGDGITREEVVGTPGDPGELTPQQWEERCRDYANCVVEPDFSIFRPEHESEYATIEIDDGRWWRDFLAHCQTEVGSDVTIHRHTRTNEIEFMRGDYAPKEK